MESKEHLDKNVSQKAVEKAVENNK